jgi:hypothetical protein
MWMVLQRMMAGVGRAFRAIGERPRRVLRRRQPEPKPH